MTLLPIVARELRVTARQRRVYWGRVATAGIAILVFAWVALFLVPLFRVTFSQSGSWIFRNLVLVAAAYGAIGGVVATADSLSREKRDGTLGLLFLTDLRGYDVVLGKLVAGGVRSLYSMLAAIPILAVAIAMGGVTYAQVALAVVAIGNLLFFSMVLGMRVSVVSLSERKALFAGLVLLMVAVLGPWVAIGIVDSVVIGGGWQSSVVSLACVSPFYPVVQLLTDLSSTPAVRGPALGHFWSSVVLVQILGWGLLAGTFRRVTRVWQAPSSFSGLTRVRHGWEQGVFGWGTGRTRLRRRLLERNPFLWVLHRERMKAGYAWGYLGIVLTVWLIGNWHSDRILYEKNVAIPTLLLIQGFLKVWVISECVSRLVEDRRGGAMELLLTTPLSDTGVLRGYGLALRRLFLGPTLALAAFECFVLGQVFGAWIGFGSAVVLAADMVSVSWAAIWYGLVSRGVNRALLLVTALVLVLPWGLVGLWLAAAAAWEYRLGAWAAPTFTHGFVAWCVASLLVDGFYVYRARQRIKADFRRVASEGVGRSVFGLKPSP